MLCNQCNRYLDAYEEGSLTDTLRRAVETHLATCETCREEARSTRHLLGLLRDAAEITPPVDFAASVLEAVSPPWYRVWLQRRFWPLLIPACLVLVALAFWGIRSAPTPDRPSDAEIAQALSQVQYALGVVQYAADKTGTTLAELGTETSREIEEPMRSASQATENSLTRGLSLALIPLKRITSFGWRSSP